MAKTEMIRARITPDLKTEAESIFKKLGLSTTEAITLFLSQVKLYKGLPFPVRIPNKTTLEAMKKAKMGKELNTYESLEDFFKKMGV
jgi:DNA-damage-inducible protein J